MEPTDKRVPTVEQWEALADKIDGAGGVQELTSANYDYPADNPNRISPFNLSAGVYKIASGTRVLASDTYGSASYTTIANGGVYIVGGRIAWNGYDTWAVTLVYDAGIQSALVRRNSSGVASFADLTSGQSSKHIVLTSSNIATSLGNQDKNAVSQNAATKMVYADPTTRYKVHISGGTGSAGGTYSTGVGYNNYANGDNSVALGYSSTAGTTGAIAIGNSSRVETGLRAIAVGQYASGTGTSAIAIGSGTGNSSSARAQADYSIALGQNASVSLQGYSAIVLGQNATANFPGSVALGADSSTTIAGQVQIGTSNTITGYNSSNYRLLSGLYDPQSDHDAATKGYVDNAVINGGTTQPTTSTVGSVGTQYNCVNNGTPEIYICTDTTGGTYTWTKIN